MIELRTAAFAHGLTVMKGDSIRDVATWLRRRPSGAEHDYAEAFAGVWAGSAIRYPRISPDMRLNAQQEVDARWQLAMSDLVGTVAENRCTYAERAEARRLLLGRPVSAGDDL